MLGALPGVIGTLQAMEAIKVITGYGRTLVGRMLHYDATEAKMRQIILKPDPACALCGPERTITKPVIYNEPSGESSGMQEIDVQAAKQLLDNGFNGILLDVRERDEHASAHIAGCRLAPLSEFMMHLDDLPRDQPYLVYCKMGQRSAHAASMMLQAGFNDVTNMRGGILSWLDEIGEVVQA